MPRQSITFTENNKRWLAEKAASGDFASESEVVNSAIRQARERDEYNEWLLGELQKGLDSGLAPDKTRDELVAWVKDRAAQLG